jgi:hypothetical protein
MASDLRTKHKEAWQEYGCTLMSDWVDRHLALPFDQFPCKQSCMDLFLGYVDASSEVANASMLVDLLEKQIDKIGK